jgi:hypothetical protein
MHLTALSRRSRSIVTGGRDASERVDAITGMRTYWTWIEVAPVLTWRTLPPPRSPQVPPNAQYRSLIKTSNPYLERV